MDHLARRVGLGLAARGDVDEIIDSARLARDSGLEAVWIHDSYFERDAVTYSTAVATALAAEGGEPFRVGLGAVNPFTRHPVVLAMTGSALDEILPERISMALGTGQPLRLAQMGIPYTYDEGVERLGATIDQLRALWAGERIAIGNPSLPPVQPMFPPVHRIPLYIAANRGRFVELAGRKADGYLARPGEALPTIKVLLERLHAAAIAAGRDPAEVDTAGYLLTHVEQSRREALNRAKREPFVIYMMTLQTDATLARLGFEPELRDKVKQAWLAEDYHGAANLIPDDLLDAFVLCGTREDVAERAQRFVAGTGLALPLLQPILQEQAQTREVVAAARLFGELAEPARRTERVAEPVPAAEAAMRTIEPPAPAPGRGSEFLRRARGRAAGVWEISRPFAFTVSLIPVLSGAALAYFDNRFAWLPALAALAASLLLQAAANVINEVYDVRQGIDTITSPRASQAIVKGRLGEGTAQALALGLFAAAAAIGLYLVALRGPAMAALGLFGIVAGYTYTAPPFHLKYRALGVPLIVLVFGPVMVAGSYFAVSGVWDPRALVLSVPAGLFVGAVVQGNEWRDIGDDGRAGIQTLSIKYGRRFAHYAYLAFVLGAYLSLGVALALRWLPSTVAIALFSLPLLAQVMRSAALGGEGQVRAIAMIDVETARLYLAFGTLLLAGLVMSRILPG